MNTLEIYYSKFGHTRRLAESMATVLLGRAVDIDQLQVADLEAAQLVVMGSPTHRMKLPEEMQKTLEQLPRRCLKGKFVAAFDTSYKMSPILMRMTASNRLLSKLRRLGGKGLAPPETFFVVERSGPLYEGELERAEDWARGLQASLPEGAKAAAAQVAGRG